jgi:hypothetical protein
MVAPFHIFKVQSNGSLRWMEAAADVEHAKASAMMLAASAPSEYVITDMTGEKISVKFPRHWLGC